MNFYSTNHSAPQVSFREAVLHGMPPDNGLYMPLSIPKIPENLLKELPHLNFQELAFEISKLWLLDDIDEKWLKMSASTIIPSGVFATKDERYYLISKNEMQQ